MGGSFPGGPSGDEFHPDAALRLVTFYMPLPAPISTPGSTTVTIDLGEPCPEFEGVDMRVTSDGPSIPNSGNRFASIQLLQVSADTDIWGIPAGQFMSIVRDKNPELDWKDPADPGKSIPASTGVFTVAECVTSLKPDADDSVSEAFDRCLESLVDLSRAHRLVTREAIPIVSYEALPMMLPYVVRAFDSPGPPTAQMLGVFLVHPRPPFGITAQELSPRDMERLTVYLGSIRERHPGIPYAELRLESRLAHERYGAYRQSVVMAHTAVEVLLDTVLALMLWEEGVSAVDAAATVFSGYASARAVREFHPRLGGDWRTTGSGAISQYLNTLAPLRHRTVHLGYSPTQDESNQAQQVAVAVEDHIGRTLLAVLPV